MPNIFPSHASAIVYRQSTLMLVSLSGVHPAINLSLADVLLIDAMLRHKQNRDVIGSFFSTAMGKRLRQSVSDAQILNRINELEVVKHQCNAFSDIEVVPLSEQPVTDSGKLTSMDEQFYLSMHHSVYLAQSGFVCYAPAMGTYVSLTGEQTILLLSFAGGTKPDALFSHNNFAGADQQALFSWLQSMLNAGVLVTKSVIETPQKAKLSSFSTQSTDNPTIELDWKAVDSDGRIPVYFVPHMENHFPLALGVLLNALNEHNSGVLRDKFLFLPITYLEPTDLINGPYRKFGTGIWLFSNYMWSIDLNMQISNAIKQHDSGNFTIHGGPSTPDYPEACETFLKDNPSVDIAVHGEGEVTITEIFEVLAQSFTADGDIDRFRLSKVTGITFKDPIANNIIRTGSRERMKEPDSVPSPYLSGVFDNYQGRVEAAIIETNRGCPYGCTFCDWGSATNQKIRKFDLERVYDEITWIGRNKIRVIWIADANYGLYERDIDISKHIVATKKKYGFPQEVVVNYTKNSTRKLVDIIKVFSEGGIISQGIISIQTTDEKTLEVINRKNIRTERYDELSEIFAEQKLPLSTDLMIGLPGITVDSFKLDLQRYIDKDISVKAYPTQLLPNSPMADPEYIKKYQIKVDKNNFILSTYSFTQQELVHMKGLFQVYEMAEGYGLLRYLTRYLQWEYEIQAIEFLETLLIDVNANPNTYPLLTWGVHYFNVEKNIPGGWHAFYRELASYLINRYEIADDSRLATVLAVSAASMPDDGLQYPYVVETEHDFVAYFVAAKEQFQPLSAYGKSEFSVSDPNSLVDIDLNATQYDSHQYFWELQSEISRPKSVVKV
ncbi:B12-binding domain-containing radical SAM protein [Planctobacterium marinum]|uniref:B12-binding domain-containing radical SAM protein n=1 Tax=Planctobacterium marinum TaxID=1631968 RepID=UPI001E319E0D|nr:radical SAM protein [Planctobacterium marinum]MCC2605521.1 radical SAM protein [Planctobacterium marinum]